MLGGQAAILNDSPGKTACFAALCIFPGKKKPPINAGASLIQR
jgi:hypothetical protein